MVIGHAPGAGVEVVALGKAHFLTCTVEFAELIAAAQRPAAAAGSTLVFKQLHLVAGRTQFVGCHHACQASAQHQNRCTRSGVAELDRTAVMRFGGISQ